ncbi:MAG: ABC transporter substrate-binding protein [Myxococcota bacterium]
MAAIVAAGLSVGAGELSFYEESLPTSLNPLFARSMVDRRAQELVFDRLYYRSAVTAEVKSRLVVGADVLDGGLRIRLTLRSDVKWHDGQPLTPADVCFTIAAMADPGTPSTGSKVYQDTIAGCEATKKDVTITFRKPYHNPTERLDFLLLPEHVFPSTAIAPDTDFASRPVGTGPMRASRGKREVRFTAFANPHHPQRIGVAALSEGGDTLIQVRTLMNAGVHGIVNVPPPLRAEVAATDDIALKSYDLRSWWFMALNTRKGALVDKRVRKALDVALDREELRRLTMGFDPEDVQQPCQFVSGPFVPASAYYNRSVPVATRSDFGQVKALMAAAGATQTGGSWTWKGQPVVLKIGMEGPLDLEAKDLLNQVGNQLQSAGFGRQVHKLSADQWTTEAITGRLTDFDVLIGKWSFGAVENVAPMFQTRAGGKGSMNLLGYSNGAVDAILERYDAARTVTEAQDAYHDLHAYLADDLPYLFLWKLDTKSAWRNEVRNNTIAPYYYFTEFDGWTL